MVLGKHILPNRRAELLGLAGVFTTDTMTFRDAEMNIEMELAYIDEDKDQNTNTFILGAINGAIGTVVAVGSKVGVATSAALKAGAVFGSVSLGTGLIIAGAVITLLMAFNALGWFNDSATWDEEAIRKAYGRMTSKDDTHSVASYMGRIGSQLPTSKFQDDRLVFYLNQMFVILAYYKAFWKAEHERGWKSKASEINTRQMYEKFSGFYGSHLNKVKSLGAVYEVHMMPLQIRLANPEYGFFHLFGGFSVPDIVYNIDAVALKRKDEARNAIIPLDDFAFPERASADLLIASWKDPVTRQKLIEAGTKINFATKPMGYNPYVTKDKNGNYIVDSVKMTEDDHDDNARDEIIKNNTTINTYDLFKELRKYYNESSISLEDIKKAIQKEDFRKILEAYNNAGIDVTKLTAKPELHCWLQSHNAELYNKLIEKYSIYFGYGAGKYPSSDPMNKALREPCNVLPSVPTPPSGGSGNTPSVPATPNTGGAVLPSVPTPPSGGNGNTPSVPATPNTGGAVLPSVPTPPSGGSGNTPSVPATPNTGGAVLPSVPTPPSGGNDTTNAGIPKVKKSGFPWWILLIPFGIWAMSDNDKKKKADK